MYKNHTTGGMRWEGWDEKSGAREMRWEGWERRDGKDQRDERDGMLEMGWDVRDVL